MRDDRDFSDPDLVSRLDSIAAGRSAQRAADAPMPLVAQLMLVLVMGLAGFGMVFGFIKAAGLL